MDASGFLERIKEFAVQYKKWSEPIRQFEETFVPRKAYPDCDEFEERLNAVSDFTLRQRGHDDVPGRISEFLDDNYLVYLGASPEDCQKIRESFAGNHDFENYLLFDYTPRTISKLHESGDEIWLWRGLAAVSLENCEIDFWDTVQEVLAELFAAAEMHGFNPKGVFKKVAGLSSDRMTRRFPMSIQESMMTIEDHPLLKDIRDRIAFYKKIINKKSCD
jgi:hypothetical protein